MSTSTTSKSSGVVTAALCVLVAAVCAASVIAVSSGLHAVWRSIFVLVAVAVGVLVVLGASSKQGSASGVVLGTLAAFASFAVFTALIQAFGGGSAPVRANSAERVDVKNKVLAEGHALLEKYGLSGDPSAVFGKSLSQIKARKVGATTVVVPGSPTALKAAAAAPAPAAPAPAAGAAPAAPTPTPAAPAPTAPATPAPTTPPAPK